MDITHPHRANSQNHKHILNTTYDLLLARKQCGANAMHRRITPALIVEPARAIEVVKERRVGGPAPEIEARDLKVAPD